MTRERELRMSVREAVLDATAVRDSKLLISASQGSGQVTSTSDRGPKGVICGRLCMGEMSAQVPLPLQQTLVLCFKHATIDICMCMHRELASHWCVCMFMRRNLYSYEKIHV